MITHLGATGEFPDGKLNEDDEGELAMSVQTLPDGKIILSFGKAVEWVAFSSAEASVIAGILYQHARKARQIKNEQP